MFTGPSFQVGHQIVSRLFDHRHFTSGEIGFFTKGMSSKADLANLDKILKINETSCVVADFCIHETGRLDSEPFGRIRDKVADLVKTSERIMSIEGDKSQKEMANLSAVRQERDKSKQDAYKAANAKLEALKEELLEEELELERKYLRLEESLH